MESTFLKSSTTLEQCPKDGKPEFAFIGRSNVGKSSLINMLLERKELARTSGTPGKTREINHFEIDGKWYLVDLPGFGYARISKVERKKWVKMINTYLRNREKLLCTFLLIDSRIPPQKNDLEFFDTLGNADIPFAIIFTKGDKQSIENSQAKIDLFIKEIKKKWSDMPDYFLSSSVSKLGRKEILSYMKEQLNQK